jgi:hypothetical protein
MLLSKTLRTPNKTIDPTAIPAAEDGGKISIDRRFKGLKRPGFRCWLRYE